MRTATILLISVASIMLVSAVLYDFALANEYRKTDTTDRLRNYLFLKLPIAKVLYLRGGNSYAISIREGAPAIRLLKSRQEFYHQQVKGDTLFLDFTVANQNYQRPEACTNGLILSFPTFSKIILAGVNVSATNLNRVEELTLQNGAFLRLDSTIGNSINLNCLDQSVARIMRDVRVKSLQVILKNKAVLELDDFKTEDFQHTIDFSSRLLLSEEAFENLPSGKR